MNASLFRFLRSRTWQVSGRSNVVHRVLVQDFSGGDGKSILPVRVDCHARVAGGYDQRPTCRRASHGRPGDLIKLCDCRDCLGLLRLASAEFEQRVIDIVSGLHAEEYWFQYARWVGPNAATRLEYGVYDGEIRAAIDMDPDPPTQQKTRVDALVVQTTFYRS